MGIAGRASGAAIAPSRAGPLMPDLVLDTGVLIGLADGDPVVRAFLQAAFDEPSTSPTRIVPAVVVAEAVRGGPRDAVVNRFLKHADTPAADVAAARTAGTLLGAVGGNATIDALLVAAAMARPGSVIVTVDRDDIPALADAAGVRVELLKS